MNPCVVFDLDDTLYPEVDYVRSGITAVARTIKECFGTDLREALLDSWDAGNSDFLATACRLLGQPDSLKESLLWTYRLHHPSISLPPVSQEAIAECLGRGYQLAILTDGRSITQRLKLKALGLAHLPAYISEDWLSEKPAPQRFSQIMVDIAAPHYIYIGDNPAKDFKAPNDLGWLTICVQHGGTGVHPQCEAISDPAFLPQSTATSVAEAVRRLGDALGVRHGQR